MEYSDYEILDELTTSRGEIKRISVSFSEEKRPLVMNSEFFFFFFLTKVSSICIKIYRLIEKTMVLPLQVLPEDMESE